MSVTKSESEWTASATIAALCPKMPATNLNATSKAFITPPHSVTRQISLLLSIAKSRNLPAKVRKDFEPTKKKERKTTKRKLRFLRREWGLSPLCGAEMTFSHFSKDPSRPESVRGSLVYRKSLLHQNLLALLSVLRRRRRTSSSSFPLGIANASIALLSLNQDLSSVFYVDSLLWIAYLSALEVEDDAVVCRLGALNGYA